MLVGVGGVNREREGERRHLDVHYGVHEVLGGRNGGGGWKVHEGMLI